MSALGSDASSHNPTGLISITRANQGGTNNYSYYGMYNGTAAVGMGLSTTGQWLFGASSAAGVNSTISTTWAYFDTSGNLYSSKQFRSTTFADSTNPASYYLTPSGTSVVSVLNSTGGVGFKNDGTGVGWGSSAFPGGFVSHVYDNGNLHIWTDDQTNFESAASGSSATWYWTAGASSTSGGGSTYMRLVSNNLYLGGTFYDDANNAYYLKPSSTSVLNNLTVNGTLSAAVFTANNLGNGPVSYTHLTLPTNREV